MSTKSSCSAIRRLSLYRDWKGSTGCSRRLRSTHSDADSLSQGLHGVGVEVTLTVVLPQGSQQEGLGPTRVDRARRRPEQRRAVRVDLVRDAVVLSNPARQHTGTSLYPVDAETQV